MKIILSFVLLVFYSNLFAQGLDTLRPVFGNNFDFGVEVQNDWKKRNQLLHDLENEEKDWEKLTEEESQLFEKYDETYLSMWDVEGGGCSWYCGAGGYSVSSSSQLQSNGEFSYSSKNLTDFSYETAWVEGRNGIGIGESITFTFPPTHPRVTEVKIANGYIKSKKSWVDNSRVHMMKMFVNNEPFAIIELMDLYALQTISLPSSLGYSDRDDFAKLEGQPEWKITFEIISVYPGLKYEDTSISEIFFDGLDVHCLAKGTMITMANNELKEIESLKLGDEILSFNKESRKFETSVILELANPVHKELIQIYLSNGTTITSTKDHPFLNDKLEWTSFSPKKTENDYDISGLKQLEVKSKLKTMSGTTEVLRITEINLTQITYTIVNLTNNSTFIADGIITGIEKLRVPTRAKINAAKF